MTEESLDPLMAAAKQALASYPGLSELPYFMRPESDEYEPFLLALRAAAAAAHPLNPEASEPVFVVTWRDSNRYLDQVNADLEFEVEVISTVGWLVDEDESKVVLAQDAFHGVADTDVRGVIVIPRESIISVTAVPSGEPCPVDLAQVPGPPGSVVARVATAMYLTSFAAEMASAESYWTKARLAIREVAAWLGTNDNPKAADDLLKELKR